MAAIRPIDMRFLDDVFEMDQGYVLDFSDRTMGEFFAQELNIDIDDPAYQRNGTSKAKRLRCFLTTVDAPTVVRALNALWEYREAIRMQRRREETVPNAAGRFLELVSRVGGDATPEPTFAPRPAYDRTKFLELHSEFTALGAMDPHPRGYAFEKFLKKLFNTFNLQAQDAFRLRGEQIDGSFLLDSETYLLEAKWHGPRIGNAELHAFHGKVEQKAAWTRGLFISHSGFTDDGLCAFGRGKRVICMDGLDLHDALSRDLPIDKVLERKVRRAAETGEPFARVRDLFPA